MGICLSGNRNHAKNKINPSIDSLTELSNLTPKTEDEFISFGETNKRKENSRKIGYREHTHSKSKSKLNNDNKYISQFEKLRGSLNGSWKTNNPKKNDILNLNVDYLAQISLFQNELFEPILLQSPNVSNNEYQLNDSHDNSNNSSHDNSYDHSQDNLKSAHELHLNSIYNFDALMPYLWELDFTESFQLVAASGYYIISIYFENEQQLALILSISIDTIANCTSNISVRESLPQIIILSIHGQSIHLGIKSIEIFIHFYSLLIEYLKSSKGIVSAYGMRFLNRKLNSETEISIRFILSTLRFFDTKFNEIIFENSFDDELKILEERFNFSADLSMSDNYSISMNIFKNAKPTMDTIDTCNSSTSLHSSSSMESKLSTLKRNISQNENLQKNNLSWPFISSFTLLFIKIQFDTLINNYQFLKRTSLQFNGKIIYVDRDWDDSEQAHVIIAWEHLDSDENISNLENSQEDLLRNQDNWINNGNLKKFTCSKIKSFSQKNAANLALQAANFIRELYGYNTNLLIVKKKIFSGYITDLLQKSRIQLFWGDIFPNSKNILKQLEKTKFEGIIVDEDTIQDSDYIFLINNSLNDFNFQYVNYVLCQKIVDIPTVVEEIHASKISLMHSSVENIISKKNYQTMILVGKDSTMEERIQLHNTIQNYIIENHRFRIYLLRCTSDKVNSNIPFSCIRKFLRELIQALNIRDINSNTTNNFHRILNHYSFDGDIDHPIDNIFDLDDSIQKFLRGLIQTESLIYLPTLNAPFGTHFLTTPESRTLFGHDLESVQDDLLLQIFSQLKKLLRKPIIFLIDSFEYFDRRSKQVINILWDCFTQPTLSRNTRIDQPSVSSQIDESILFSISLSDAKFWHQSVDIVIDVGPLATRSQFEKSLEISLRDYVLGIDEQFIYYIMTTSNFNLQFAWEIVHFLIIHNRVEIDENNILQFDSSILNSNALRFSSYTEFLQFKLSNMEMNLQLILSSLSIFKEPFSFQLATYILKDKFPGSMEFLKSSLDTLSSTFSENDYFHSHFLSVDEQNRYKWASISHREASISFLSLEDEITLKKNYIQFLELFNTCGEELILASEIILSLQIPSFIIEKISIVDEAVHLLENQHRFEEAFDLLKLKIIILSKEYKNSQNNILASDYLQLSNLMRKLFDDDPGSSKDIIDTLREGLIYCGSNTSLLHRYYFQLWYLTNKICDIYSSSSYSKKVFEIQESIKNSQDFDIAQVFTCYCSCSTLFSKEKYSLIIENEIEKCLVLYGKNSDEIHLRAMENYGYVDPIVGILSYASCSAWLLTNWDKARKYYSMAIQLSNRVINPRFKKEIFITNLLPCFYLVGEMYELKSLKQHFNCNLIGSTSPKKNQISENFTLNAEIQLYQLIYELNDSLSSGIEFLKSHIDINSSLNSNLNSENINISSIVTYSNQESNNNNNSFIERSLHILQCENYALSKILNIKDINEKTYQFIERFEELYSHVTLQSDHIVLHIMRLHLLLFIKDPSSLSMIDRILQNNKTTSENILPITPRSLRLKKHISSLTTTLFTALKALQITKESTDKASMLRSSIDSQIPLEIRILCAIDLLLIIDSLSKNDEFSIQKLIIDSNSNPQLKSLVNILKSLFSRQSGLLQLNTKL